MFLAAGCLFAFEAGWMYTSARTGSTTLRRSRPPARLPVPEPPGYTAQRRLFSTTGPQVARLLPPANAYLYDAELVLALVWHGVS